MNYITLIGHRCNSGARRTSPDPFQSIKLKQWAACPTKSLIWSSGSEHLLSELVSVNAPC